MIRLPLPSRPWLPVLLAGTLVVGGCAALAASGSSSGSRGDHVVTAAQIEKSSASTAWEAIRRTLRGVQLSEDANGNPTGMSHRGASSLLLTDQPRVFVDGVRISDFRQLHAMPARDVATIHFVSGLNATTRYGTNSGDGVILIVTRQGYGANSP